MPRSKTQILKEDVKFHLGLKSIMSIITISTLAVVGYYGLYNQVTNNTQAIQDNTIIIKEAVTAQKKHLESYNKMTVDIALIQERVSKNGVQLEKSTMALNKVSDDITYLVRRSKEKGNND